MMKRTAKNTNSNLIRICFSLVTALLLSACALTSQTQTPNYYVLDATAQNIDVVTSNKISVGIGPIELAGYVDRPQIVTRMDSSKLHLAEFDRWAEPLDAMYSRALIENVKILSGSDQIFPYPGRIAIPEPDYRISASILKFETNLNGEAIMAVQWSIVTDQNLDTSQSIYSTFTAQADSQSYPDKIAALNNLIAQFAAQITQRIR